MKKLGVICLGLIYSASLCNGQSVIDENVKINSSDFLFPFNGNRIVSHAVLWFNKVPNNGPIRLYYRVVLKQLINELYMKDAPQMLIKIGDGTILTAKKERIQAGFSDYNECVDVYFLLNEDLQKKILKYGIEKVRFAYVFSFRGVTENQYFDAYTKNSADEAPSVQKLLSEAKSSSFHKAKEVAEVTEVSQKTDHKKFSLIIPQEEE